MGNLMVGVAFGGALSFGVMTRPFTQLGDYDDMNNNLTEARWNLDAARWNLDRAKAAWRDKKSAAAAASAVAAAERHERNMIISRGGPRPAPNFVPPKTAAQLAADEAQAACDGAEARMNSAQIALNAAAATLLAQENRILTRWRDSLARTIRQAQTEGWPDEIVAPLLADLRLMCPPDTVVRLHQRFTLSAIVREVLDEQPHELHLHTPVDQLRGEVGGAAYEKKRAQILAEFETESPSPLEAA
jgi:hypothetical protein